MILLLFLICWGLYEWYLRNDHLNTRICFVYEPTIVDNLTAWNTYVMQRIIWVSFSTPFLSLFPHPIQCLKSAEIAGTSFQHYMRGRGRGKAGEVVFASGVCAKAPKAQICPIRLLFTIVAWFYIYYFSSLLGFDYLIARVLWLTASSLDRDYFVESFHPCLDLKSCWAKLLRGIASTVLGFNILLIEISSWDRFNHARS